jgi:Uma2 family endonuclease
MACEVFPDGMAVRVSANTVYEPDASVRCGPPVPDDAVDIADPIVVVEVLSPSTGARDAGAKLADYFLLPSVRHHLIVDTKSRTVIHHARPGGGNEIATRAFREGALQLDPPGIALDVAALFLGLVPGR